MTLGASCRGIREIYVLILARNSLKYMMSYCASIIKSTAVELVPSGVICSLVTTNEHLQYFFLLYLFQKNEMGVSRGSTKIGCCSYSCSAGKPM